MSSSTSFSCVTLPFPKLINSLLEHPQQMWDMCQMLNIWHISHTKPNLSPFSRCGILYFFFPTLNSTVTNLPQYGRDVGKILLFVYFFLSPFSVSLLSLTQSSPLLSLSPTPTIISTPTLTPISL